MKFTIVVITILFLSFYVVAAQNNDIDNELQDADYGDEDTGVETRVIGGRPTRNYPHIVSLQKSQTHYCAGSIISANWIVSSATCVPTPVTEVEALAGVTNLRRANSRNAQRRKVVLFIRHPDFDATVPQSINDIALGKVDQPFVLNNLRIVSTIGLPNALSYPENTAYIAGWGKFSTRYPNDSPVLRHLQVPVFNKATCDVLWANTAYKSDLNCCGGNLNGFGATCTSDAGGPLMTQVRKRPLRYTLVGIATWIPTDCSTKTGKPSVYTLVSAYIDWLQNQIEQNK